MIDPIYSLEKPFLKFLFNHLINFHPMGIQAEPLSAPASHSTLLFLLLNSFHLFILGFFFQLFFHLTHLILLIFVCMKVPAVFGGIALHNLVTRCLPTA
uniref:Uncharacterized protein n=1 Tax=Oryza glaberrima TaxID=4538 RepID=I1R2A5_ORYGL